MPLTKEQNDLMKLRRKIRKQLRRCDLSKEEKAKKRFILRMKNGQGIPLTENNIETAWKLAQPYRLT